MRVADVMTRNVRTARVWETLDLDSALSRLRRFRQVPVLDGAGHVVGLLARTDLLEAAARTVRPHKLRVAETLHEAVTVDADLPLDAAAKKMLMKAAGALCVIGDDGSFLGLVTDGDLLAGLRNHPPVRVLEGTVDAVMSRDVESIEPEAPLSDAANAMLRGGFRHLPVVDGQARLIGILSDRDVRAHLGTDLADFLQAPLEARCEPVSGAMTPDPIYFRAGTPLDEAVAVFADERLAAVPVVDGNDRLVGIVSYVDLLASLHERVMSNANHAPAAADF